MPVVEVPAAPRRAVCCAGPIAGHRQLDSLANRWGVEPLQAAWDRVRYPLTLLKPRLE